MKWLKNSLALPEFKNGVEKARLKAFLRGILLFALLNNILGTASIFATNPRGQYSTLIINGLLLITQILAWAALQKDRLAISSIILILSLWLYTSLALYAYGGLRNPISGILLVLILIAGTLLGRFGIILTVGLTAVSSLLISFLELSGRMPPPIAPVDPAQAWIVYFSTVIGSGVVMYLWYSNIQESMEHVRLEVSERQKAEGALLESESRLRSLLATIPDLIFITDVEGRYVEIFTGRDDLLVVPREKILGKTIAEVLSPALAQDMLKVIYAAIESPEIQEYEYQLTTPGGSTWFQARVLAYRVSEATYVMWLARDITARKESEALQQSRREMLEKVIELGKAATRMIDLDECLQTIHRSIRIGLGFDRVGIFLHDEKNNSIQGAYGTRLDGEMENTQWFVQSVDEYQAWQTVISDPKGFVFVDDYQRLYNLPADSEMAQVKQHVTVAAWAGEKPVAVISADNCLSQRRITEEQVEALRLFAGYAGLAIENARSNTLLEQRVEQRTAELESTLRELEAFSYTVSHDLRAPLRGMNGFAHMLEAEYGENLPAPALGYIQKIKQNTKNMGELVDGLLTFSRLGRQTFTKQNLDIEALAYEVVKELTAKVPPGQLEVIIRALPVCRADRMLMRTVLEHLVANALKFTRTRPQANIEIGFEQQEGQNTYYVRDNGVGFDMRYVHKLFGVFQRLHAQDEFEGTGVGLAIVQRIIHKHDGKVWATSQVNQGATFYFTLG
jgi:PAS domain S-box-containing protein